MWAKRQWNPIFNLSLAFELLPQHFFQILELEYKGHLLGTSEKDPRFPKKKG
jgi:hypothetical protein